MQISTTSLALVFAVSGAAAFAFFHDDPATANMTPASLPPPQAEEEIAPASEEPPLPPNHPAIAGKESAPTGDPGFVAPKAGPSAIEWKAPASWTTAPNPSPMRLATYKVPRAGKDTEEAEVAIMQAGGDIDANIQRWVDQFEGTKGAKREEKTVSGLRVVVVEVEGKYLGGMGPASAEHAGWSLLGAIVSTPEQPTFFKMTGPSQTVHAARKAFEEMLEGIRPAS